MKEVLSILFSTRGEKPTAHPRLFENRRDEGRKRRGKVAPQPSPQAGAHTAETGCVTSPLPPQLAKTFKTG